MPTPQDLMTEAGRCFHTGNHERAVELLREVVRQRPDALQAHRGLVQSLLALRDFAEAVAVGQAAVALHPKSADLHCELGQALWQNRQATAAIEATRLAVALDERSVIAWNNLGCALKDVGELDEGMSCLRRALAIDPSQIAIHNNLIYTMHFHAGCDPHAIRREQENWVRTHTAGIKPFRHDANDRDPKRRLRVGYVSPDFYAQAECYFVLPLIEAHDRGQFEVHCYSSVRRADEVTDRYRRSADRWHDVLSLTDRQLAQKIREDGIDVLIDLTMHMRHSRLPVFAHKPAPVQVCWLAYPGSTGLPQMDYRLTDAHMDPSGADDSWSAEEAIRLPQCWCCYEAVGDSPAVAPSPAKSRGYVTYGSLNNFCKVNDAVLGRWARVMQATPGSRLLLLCPEDHARRRVLTTLAKAGIDAARVEFTGMVPRYAYLDLYSRIDIALDPFPYNGITTTCDALWMGVPVTTLPGSTPASRAGLSLLTAAGFSQWIARDEEDYVRLTAALAGDIIGLAQTRASLRGKVEASALMDAPGFTRAVEDAYRTR